MHHRRNGRGCSRLCCTTEFVAREIPHFSPMHRLLKNFCTRCFPVGARPAGRGMCGCRFTTESGSRNVKWHWHLANDVCGIIGRMPMPLYTTLSFPVSTPQRTPALVPRLLSPAAAGRSDPYPVSENLHFNRWSEPPSAALVGGDESERQQPGDRRQETGAGRQQTGKPENLKPETGDRRQQTETPNYRKTETLKNRAESANRSPLRRT